MYACRVAVVKQGDVRREAVQYVYLMHRKRRTRVSHYVLYAALMHGDDVGVALHHVHTVFLGYRLLSLIDAIQLAVLVVNLRVGRVDVLLVHALCARVEQSSAEAHHLSADAYPREDNASGIAVD